jgi:hypothetical protein
MCLTGGTSPDLRKRTSLRVNPCQQVQGHSSSFDKGRVWTDNGVAVGAALVFVLDSNALPQRSGEVLCFRLAWAKPVWAKAQCLTVLLTARYPRPAPTYIFLRES